MLTIVGEDDKQVHPKWHFFSLDNWPNEFKNNLEVHAYPGAGHLIEPPYAPYTRAVKVSKAKMETIDFLTEKFHGKAIFLQLYSLFPGHKFSLDALLYTKKFYISRKKTK